MSWLEILLIGYVGWCGGVICAGWIASLCVRAYERRQKRLEYLRKYKEIMRRKEK